MHKFSITPDVKNDFYAPGTTLSGKIHWDLTASTEYLTLQLFWYTSGKGTRDYAVVQEQRIENPLISGEEHFSFRIPAQPLSFSGTLISLQWALELKPADEREAEQFHFRVAMSSEELVLPAIDDPDSSLKKRLRR